MAYRELGMVELREILRRWMAGEGLRAMARGTGVDRKTVAEHVRAAAAIGLQRGGAPPTDEQVAAVLARRRPGRPLTAEGLSPEVAALWPYQERIQRWLSTDALRLTKIHRRLRAEGVAVSYSTLYRFARARCDFRPAALTVRVADPPPGEVAEADFGLLGMWADPATAQRRRVWGLLVTLCYSRYAFLAVSFRQDLPAVLDGLEAAWAFFAGVVRRLVIDNRNSGRRELSS
jgi:transposase